jgi:chromosome segregation ATPase
LTPNSDTPTQIIYRRVEKDIDSNKWWWATCYSVKEAENLVNLLNGYEKKLNASQAEVEELQQQKRNCIEIIDDDAKEKSELKAEVERLTGRMKEAEDLIKGLHDGWKKARKAHLETCKNAQTEIDKLYTQNVCLQELIQDFYEWSRRDYPTEQEVREIMNRYYNLLNKK